MQVRWVPILAVFLSAQCSYNHRVEAPDAAATPSTPYVPPTAPTPDLTPPANVSATLITASNNALQISWSNPTDADYKATRIYWATSAANLNSAGTRTLLCDDCISGLVHSALTNGTTYYYLFISYDYTGNLASGISASGTATNNSFSCPNTAAADCLQIASFNLEYFVSGFPEDPPYTPAHQQSKLTGAANVILNAGLDIVALQEVKDYAIFTDWVANYLGSDWGYAVASSGCDARTAYVYKKSLVTLMSANELSAPQLPSGNWSGCLRKPFAGIFKSVATSRIFRLIDVHLKSGSDAASCTTRQPQANDLSSYINGTNSIPTLLLGDMNDEVKAGVGICSSIDTLNALETNSNLTILTKSPTMDPAVYSNIPYTSTIDHLIVNSGFSTWIVPARASYTADVIAHGDLNISDHQPVYLWIKLR